MVEDHLGQWRTIKDSGGPSKMVVSLFPSTLMQSSMLSRMVFKIDEIMRSVRLDLVSVDSFNELEV